MLKGISGFVAGQMECIKGISEGRTIKLGGQVLCRETQRGVGAVFPPGIRNLNR